MRDRLPVDKKLMPYRYEIVLGQAVFSLEFHYNARRDFYSVCLYREKKLLCAGERLVYGMPLFADCYKVEIFPCAQVVPRDESGTVCAVHGESLGNTVFLTVENIREGADG